MHSRRIRCRRFRGSSSRNSRQVPRTGSPHCHGVDDRLITRRRTSRYGVSAQSKPDQRGHLTRNVEGDPYPLGIAFCVHAHQHRWPDPTRGVHSLVPTEGELTLLREAFEVFVNSWRHFRRSEPQKMPPDDYRLALRCCGNVWDVNWKRRRRAAALLGVLTLAISACSAPSASTDSPSGSETLAKAAPSKTLATYPTPTKLSPPTRDEDEAALRSEVYLEHEETRRSHSLGSLNTNSCLAEYAKSWAEALAAESSGISHQNLEPILDKCGMTTVGENVAAGQTSAAEVHTGWMNSPGHRRNILNSEFNQMGASALTGFDGRVYWVVVFGRAG